MPGPHDRLIAAAAKEVLVPLGFARKGRSRIWWKDNGWWLALVEFQPSGWAKGCYLNVGAHWLWVEQDYLSFDQGGRIEGFAPYRSDAQFASEAMRLAGRAAQEAALLDDRFATIARTAQYLADAERRLPQAAQGSWSALHAGIAVGMAGDAAEAEALLRPVRDERVRPVAGQMADHLSDRKTFRIAVEALIASRRTALGLADEPNA